MNTPFWQSTYPQLRRHRWLLSPERSTTACHLQVLQKLGWGETKTFKQNSGWLQGHYIYFNLELSNVSQVWRNTAVSIDYNVQLVEVNKDCQISNFWLIMNQSASAIIEVVCQNNILIVCLDLPCMYIQVVQKKHLLEERFCFSTLSLRKRGIN